MVLQVRLNALLLAVFLHVSQVLASLPSSRYHQAPDDHGFGSASGPDEFRWGRTATGHYRVPLPDGRTQVVSYTADEKGFRPVITYEGPRGASYPSSGGYTRPKPSYKPPLPAYRPPVPPYNPSLAHGPVPPPFPAASFGPIPAPASVSTPSPYEVLPKPYTPPRPLHKPYVPTSAPYYIAPDPYRPYKPSIAPYKPLYTEEPQTTTTKPTTTRKPTTPPTKRHAQRPHANPYFPTQRPWHYPPH